jgi:hypothetical protein
MPTATRTPAARIRPTLDWVAAELLERGGQVVHRRRDHRHVRRRDLLGDEPAFADADQHHFEAREFAAQVQHLQDVARALDMDEQQLPPGQHRDQRGGIEAGEQDIVRPVDLAAEQRAVRVRHLLQREVALIVGARLPLAPAAADAGAALVPADIARFAKRVAEQSEGRGAAAAGITGSGFAEFDELEGTGAGDRLHVVGKVDDRALAGEDALGGRGRHHRAGDAVGAADRHLRPRAD